MPLFEYYCGVCIGLRTVLRKERQERETCDVCGADMEPRIGRPNVPASGTYSFKEGK